MLPFRAPTVDSGHPRDLRVRSNDDEVVVSYALYFADPACAFATYGSCVILIWRREPSRARLDTALTLIRAHAAAIRGRAHLISVVEEGSPPPSLDDLRMLHASLPTMGPLIAAGVGVFETTRPERGGVLRLAELLGGSMASRMATKLCFDTEEACSWLAARIGGDHADRRALVREVEDLRASLP
jgi:hypothetical protein